MVLIITNKLDPHTDVVLGIIRSRGVGVFRFNTEDFPEEIGITLKKEGDRLKLPVGELELSQIRSCWYRRPDPPIISKEIVTKQAQEFAKDESETFLKHLWIYLQRCFWISYPTKVRQAESKIYNLKLASEVGFLTPETLITNDVEEAQNFIDKCDGNVITKVLGRGQVEYQKDYYHVYTHRIMPKDLQSIKDVVYSPTLFQEYVPKRLETRVTVVGDKVFACEIHSQDSETTKDDWRHYDFEKVKHAIHSLPNDVARKCLRMMNILGLNFSTFDLILTPGGQYVFLELNPNGQWLWIEQLTKMPISTAVADLLTSYAK